MKLECAAIENIRNFSSQIQYWRLPRCLVDLQNTSSYNHASVCMWEEKFIATGSNEGKRTRTLLDFNYVKKRNFNEEQDEIDRGSNRGKNCFVFCRASPTLLATPATLNLLDNLGCSFCLLPNKHHLLKGYKMKGFKFNGNVFYCNWANLGFTISKLMTVKMYKGKMQ